MAILMSSARNSATLIDRLAFVLGLVIGPLLAAQKVKLDLMWTGLVAGTLAYAVHRLREREDGQTTTEYAILLGFLAIAIIIALFFLRNVLHSLFSSAASSVSRAPNS